MYLSQDQIDILDDKFYTIGAKALLIRDFWKEKTDMLTVNFDTNVNKDPWLIHKFEVFNTIWERKQTDGYERVGKFARGLGGVDMLYKELLYGVRDGEYTHILQDKKTLTILDELVQKYPVDAYIDIFSFSRNDEDKVDYFEKTNPLLSLLRLEYERIIEIKDILLFSFPFSKKSSFFIEGKIKIKKLIYPTGNISSEAIAVKLSTLEESDVSVIRLNKSLKYCLRTGIFTHTLNGKTYDVGDQHRKQFIDIIINKGLKGLKAVYKDFSFVVGRQASPDIYLTSQNEDKIRNFGKSIKRSLTGAFKISNDEATFYATSKGFRLIPYKPE